MYPYDLEFSLSATDEFDLQIRDGAGNLITELGVNTQLALDLWNETDYEFSYERDAQRAAELLSWRLHSERYEADSTSLFNAVRAICEPGACRGDEYSAFFMAGRI